MWKKIIISIVLFTAIFTTVAFIYAGKQNSGSKETSTFSSGEITMSYPKPDSKISNPLNVEGKSPGSWYFEASFPIKITDANGNVLGQGLAEAQSDWMTTSSVPFKTSIIFSAPKTSQGFLVLSKDNPSGLPQNSAEVKFQINFQ
ncbi:Gmad2 immunoglobulin-like domain-containing protein [Patescibacteria group bacterium]|nr:Gmad2 immunoglobulin-like domain-containing protein [Patescibacteria group bacterium]